MAFSEVELSSLLSTNIDTNGDVNVNFIDSKQIRELNNEYRKKDEVTDVLSFNIDEDILGEVYVCLEYILETFEDGCVVEELLRVIVHGVLHLKGMDHVKKFEEKDFSDEKMYVEQEEIVEKLKSLLKMKCDMCS